jgi:hypothetical protein
MLSGQAFPVPTGVIQTQIKPDSAGKKIRKNLKKSLAMICRSDKNAVIRLNYDAMNTNNAVSQPRIRERSRTLRSLFLVAAGTLLLTAALIPQANAQQTIVYFNFEDTPGTFGRDARFDNFSDQTFLVAGEDINTGGGIQFSTLTLTTTANASTAGGLLLNRTAGDQDPANPVPPSFNGHALLFNDTKGTTATLDFTVNTTFLKDLSLSFATDNNGNGYHAVTLQYSINGGVFTTVGTQALPTMGTAITTFNIDPTDAVFKGDGTPQTTVFRLIFTLPGNTSGQDRQTVIDNIVLGGTVVPEPATVVGGLLGALGLCWHQRRRLIRLTPLRLRRT